jgi:hypothetical protein
MRKPLTLALAVGLFLGTMTATASAYENSYSKWAKQECRFSRNGSWSDSEVRDLIRCAAIRVENTKDTDAALAIAERESRFDESAENSTSSAAGVFQWLESSWPGARFPALMNRFQYPNTRYSPRAAAFVSLTVMKRYGCGAWSYSGTVLC